MNYRSPLIKSFLFALSLVFVVSSCDTDYNQLGSDVVDGDIHNNIIRYEGGITAYDAPTGSVQSNNLDINTLGVFKNPVFGKTIASFVTQVELGTTAPTFDTPILDSVYLYVPYNSALVSTDTDSESTYTIDSIYGDRTNRFKLSVLRNGYFLRDSDAGATDAQQQKYYTSDKSLIDERAGESLLANAAGEPIESVEFSYSAAEIDRQAIPAGETTAKTVERLAPGMFLPLDKAKFQSLIIDQEDTGKLANNNVFKEYFRGLYFKAEQIGDEAVMGAPKFASGVITMRYRDVTRTSAGAIVMDTTVTPNVPKYLSKTLLLNLKGNTVNLFENTDDATYASAINSSSPLSGDSRLYVKGGQGSVAYIDINPNTIDALKALNNGGNKVLINEANLVFHIDSTAMAGVSKDNEPMRIFLYDVNNKRPVYDYYVDATTLTGYPKYAKYVHGGIILRNATTNKGSLYKIRITDHINNLVNKDSTNVKLGLVVTESIALTGNAAVKTPVSIGGQQIKAIPSASVMHPFGTILYGSSADVPEGLRLTLEIFYTKPD